MKELEKVKIKNKTYYLDVRLKQLRNVKNPYDFINLNSFEILLLSNLDLFRELFKIRTKQFI